MRGNHKYRLGVTTTGGISKTSQSGFTLTEIAIVLGIIGLILGSIWIAASNVMTNLRVQRAANETMSIMNGYRTLFASSVLADGDITCVGVAAGAFPGDTLATGAAPCDVNTPSTHPHAPWPGTYFSVGGSSSGNFIQIEMYGLSRAACIGLASAEAHSGALLSIVGLQLTGANATFYPPLGSASPMTISQIESYCVAADNEVTFAYSAK